MSETAKKEEKKEHLTSSAFRNGCVIGKEEMEKKEDDTDQVESKARKR